MMSDEGAGGTVQPNIYSRGDGANLALFYSILIGSPPVLAENQCTDTHIPNPTQISLVKYKYRASSDRAPIIDIFVN